MIRNMKALFIAVFAITTVCLLAACHNEHDDTYVSVAEIEPLLERLQYLEDSNEIQKLQAKYVHFLFTQRFDRIVDEIYAQHQDDVSVEFSDSGVFRGLESITGLYAAFGRIKQLPGYFILHMATNPYLEIAEDGMSAKAHWLSPGVANSRNGSSWIWGPYYADYVKEDGEWRIHHSNLVPLFRNPYEVSWGESETHGTVKGVLGVEADEPGTLYRPFNEVRKETDIFRNHPDLPEAF